MPSPKNEVLQFSASQVVCRQNEPTGQMFLLRQGRIGIYVNATDALPEYEEISEKGKKVAELSEPGTLLGEAGLFLKKRSASMLALEDNTKLELINLGPDGAKNLILGNPRLGLSLCRSLAFHMQSFAKHVRSIGDIADEARRSSDNISLHVFRLLKRMEKHSCRDELTDIIESIKSSSLYEEGCKVYNRYESNTGVFRNRHGVDEDSEQQYKQGEIICTEDSRGRHLYLIREGKVNVCVKQAVIATVGPGEIVGEIAVLLPESPYRTARLVAANNVVLNAIGRKDFARISLAKPTLLLSIAEALSRRLENTNIFVRNTEAALTRWLDRLDGQENSASLLLENVCTQLGKLADVEELLRDAGEIFKEARQSYARFSKRHHAFLSR